uniref:Uncharacterized protein n=1 Tax=viral metagenome TaxID=1070528 RepID=A0A6C0JF61_9ZZZZ
MIFKKLLESLLKTEKPKLGRWSLKSCNELATSINSVYQNRDHCGDTICKTPKKALEYPSKHTTPHHTQQRGH